MSESKITTYKGPFLGVLTGETAAAAKVEEVNGVCCLTFPEGTMLQVIQGQVLKESSEEDEEVVFVGVKPAGTSEVKCLGTKSSSGVLKKEGAGKNSVWKGVLNDSSSSDESFDQFIASFKEKAVTKKEEEKKEDEAKEEATKVVKKEEEEVKVDEQAEVAVKKETATKKSAQASKTKTKPAAAPTKRSTRIVKRNKSFDD